MLSCDDVTVEMPNESTKNGKLRKHSANWKKRQQQKKNLKRRTAKKENELQSSSSEDYSIHSEINRPDAQISTGASIDFQGEGNKIQPASSINPKKQLPPKFKAPPGALHSNGNGHSQLSIRNQCIDKENVQPNTNHVSKPDTAKLTGSTSHRKSLSLSTEEIEELAMREEQKSLRKLIHQRHSYYLRSVAAGHRPEALPPKSQSQKLTVPVSPCLKTRERCQARKSLVASELDEKDKEFAGFRARKLDRRILESSGELGVPRVTSAPLTQCKPFALHETSKRKSVLELVQEESTSKGVGCFKARKLDRRVLQSTGEMGVPKATSAPRTQTLPFSFQTEARAIVRNTKL